MKKPKDSALLVFLWNVELPLVHPNPFELPFGKGQLQTCVQRILPTGLDFQNRGVDEYAIKLGHVFINCHIICTLRKNITEQTFQAFRLRDVIINLKEVSDCTMLSQQFPTTEWDWIQVSEWTSQGLASRLKKSVAVTPSFIFLDNFKPATQGRTRLTPYRIQKKERNKTTSVKSNIFILPIRDSKWKCIIRSSSSLKKMWKNHHQVKL